MKNNFLKSIASVVALSLIVASAAPAVPAMAQVGAEGKTAAVSLTVSALNAAAPLADPVGNQPGIIPLSAPARNLASPIAKPWRLRLQSSSKVWAARAASFRLASTQRLQQLRNLLLIPSAKRPASEVPGSAIDAVSKTAAAVSNPAGNSTTRYASLKEAYEAVTAPKKSEAGLVAVGDSPVSATHPALHSSAQRELSSSRQKLAFILPHPPTPSTTRLSPRFSRFEQLRHRLSGFAFAAVPLPLFAPVLSPLIAATIFRSSAFLLLGTAAIPAAAGIALGWSLRNKLQLSNLTGPILFFASCGLFALSLHLAPFFAASLALASGLGAAIGLTPALAKARESLKLVKENGSWVRGFWHYVMESGVDIKKDLAKASLMALFVAALAFIPPALWGNIFQHLKELGSLSLHGSWIHALSEPIVRVYLHLGGLLASVYLLDALLAYIYSKIMYGIGNKMMHKVSDLFVQHVLALKMSWHNNSVVGDVVSTMTDAIYTVQSTATNVIVDSLKYGTVALLSLGAMFVVSWKMTLILAPFLVLALSVPAAIYGKRTNAAYRLFYSQKKPKFASYVTELKVNILGVKASGKEPDVMKKVHDLSYETYMVGGGEIAKAAAPNQAMRGGISNVARVIVTLTAVAFILFGGLTIKLATFYFLVSNSFREAVERLSGVFVSLRSMRGAGDKFDRIRNQPEENANPNGVILPPSDRGRAVQFNDIKFRYNTSGPYVLNGIGLNMKPGEFWGLVGPSGSGKTTLTLALLGLYELNEGSIEIDGTDIRKLAVRPFRQNVGVALQDSIPFAASILDNIRFLKEEAPESAVWEAASKVGLHDDIMRFGYKRTLEYRDAKTTAEGEENKWIDHVKTKLQAARDYLASLGIQNLPAEIEPKKSILENIKGNSNATFDQVLSAARELGIHDDITRLGYATKVGERGVNISGGQKQRLLLARLFVDPQHPWGIMILDEPTAALDGISQGLVQKTVEEYRGKTTTILVAHRLSTIQNADKIAVFNNQGEIVQVGTHEELIKDETGPYSKLWLAQKLQAEAESTRKK